jgi:hypothetical protein
VHAATNALATVPITYGTCRGERFGPHIADFD